MKRHGSCIFNEQNRGYRFENIAKVYQFLQPRQDLEPKLFAQRVYCKQINLQNNSLAATDVISTISTAAYLMWHSDILQDDSAAR